MMERRDRKPGPLPGIRARLAALLAAALLLTACATGPRILATQVSTERATAPGADMLARVHYRFEDGPAVVGQLPQPRLQAMAADALARVGAVHDTTNPSVGVQVSGLSHAYWLRDSDFGLSNPRIALGLGTGWHGASLGFGWPMWDPDIPVYSSTVHLVMRDLQTGQIVYSTQARHDGGSHDTETVLAALFVAALEGYPTPAQGLRRVNVPLLPAGDPGEEGADDAAQP